MSEVAGPYPVLCRDPSYEAAVGHHGYGFWFRVLDERGAEVDAGGALDELTHLKDLLEATWIYLDWPNERALVDQLRRFDPALHSEKPEITQLIGA